MEEGDEEALQRAGRVVEHVEHGKVDDVTERRRDEREAVVDAEQRQEDDGCTHGLPTRSRSHAVHPDRSRLHSVHLSRHTHTLT